VIHTTILLHNSNIKVITNKKVSKLLQIMDHIGLKKINHLKKGAQA
jgi:hypothetical protein